MNAPVLNIHANLVEASKNGDQQSQYELYKLYNKAMYNTSLRIVGNTADAEDVLQESFIEAFKNLKKFRGDSTFGAWLKRIVVNRSINWIKKKKLDIVPMEDRAYSIASSPTKNESENYDVQMVREGINHLPAGYRTVFSLYALEGYDHAEIAEITGTSESTSKSQYNRAKKKLREILTDMNFNR